MRNFRLITTAMTAAVLMAGIAGCAKTEESKSSAVDTTVESSASEEASASSEATAASEATDAKFYVTINGFKLTAAPNYNDIKDKLGKEVKPSEKYEPCDPADEETMLYFYDGVTIETSLDGKILVVKLSCDDASACNASISDSVKVGDKLDDAIAKFGEPAAKNEYSCSFVDGTNTLIANYDSDTMELSSFEIYDKLVDLL